MAAGAPHLRGDSASQTVTSNVVRPTNYNSPTYQLRTSSSERNSVGHQWSQSWKPGGSGVASSFYSSSPKAKSVAKPPPSGNILSIPTASPSAAAAAAAARARSKSLSPVNAVGNGLPIQQRGSPNRFGPSVFCSPSASLLHSISDIQHHTTVPVGRTQTAPVAAGIATPPRAVVRPMFSAAAPTSSGVGFRASSASPSSFSASSHPNVHVSSQVVSYKVFEGAAERGVPRTVPQTSAFTNTATRQFVPAAPRLSSADVRVCPKASQNFGHVSHPEGDRLTITRVVHSSPSARPTYQTFYPSKVTAGPAVLRRSDTSGSLSPQSGPTLISRQGSLHSGSRTSSLSRQIPQTCSKATMVTLTPTNNVWGMPADLRSHQFAPSPLIRDSVRPPMTTTTSVASPTQTQHTSLFPTFPAQQLTVTRSPHSLFSNTTPQRPFFTSSTPQYTGFGSSTPQYTGFGSSTPQYTSFGSSTPQHTTFTSSPPQYTGFGSSTPQHTSFPGASTSTVFRGMPATTTSTTGGGIFGSLGLQPSSSALSNYGQPNFPLTPLVRSGPSPVALWGSRNVYPLSTMASPTEAMTPVNWEGTQPEFGVRRLAPVDASLSAISVRRLPSPAALSPFALSTTPSTQEPSGSAASAGSHVLLGGVNVRGEYEARMRTLLENTSAVPEPVKPEEEVRDNDSASERTASDAEETNSASAEEEDQTNHEDDSSGGEQSAASHDTSSDGDAEQQQNRLPPIFEEDHAEKEEEEGVTSVAEVAVPNNSEEGKRGSLEKSTAADGESAAAEEKTATTTDLKCRKDTDPMSEERELIERSVTKEWTATDATVAVVADGEGTQTAAEKEQITEDDDRNSALASDPANEHRDTSDTSDGGDDQKMKSFDFDATKAADNNETTERIDGAVAGGDGYCRSSIGDGSTCMSVSGVVVPTSPRSVEEASADEDATDSVSRGVEAPRGDKDSTSAEELNKERRISESSRVESANVRKGSVVEDGVRGVVTPEKAVPSEGSAVMGKEVIRVAARWVAPAERSRDAADSAQNKACGAAAANSAGEVGLCRFVVLRPGAEDGSSDVEDDESSTDRTSAELCGGQPRGAHRQMAEKTDVVELQQQDDDDSMRCNRDNWDSTTPLGILKTLPPEDEPCRPSLEGSSAVWRSFVYDGETILRLEVLVLPLCFVGGSCLPRLMSAEVDLHEAMSHANPFRGEIYLYDEQSGELCRDMLEIGIHVSRRAALFLARNTIALKDVTSPAAAGESLSRRSVCRSSIAGVAGESLSRRSVCRSSLLFSWKSSTPAEIDRAAIIGVRRLDEVLGAENRMSSSPLSTERSASELSVLTAVNSETDSDEFVGRSPFRNLNLAVRCVFGSTAVLHRRLASRGIVDLTNPTLWVVCKATLGRSFALKTNITQLVMREDGEEWSGRWNSRLLFPLNGEKTLTLSVRIVSNDSEVIGCFGEATVDLELLAQKERNSNGCHGTVPLSVRDNSGLALGLKFGEEAVARPISFLTQRDVIDSSDLRH